MYPSADFNRSRSMKVLRNGVEVKDAVIEYGDDKQPAFVTANGVRQLARAFEFEDEKPKKRTKSQKRTK
jgi:hypothetical protein